MPYLRRKILHTLFQIGDLLVMVACFLLGALAVSREIGWISFESFLNLYSGVAHERV